MSTPPRRLRDDPGFLWETGCDLADEAFAVGGYDLPSLRARVLAETQPPSGGAPLRAARGGAVGAAVAGALLLLGLGAGIATVLAPSGPATQGEGLEPPAPADVAPVVPALVEGPPSPPSGPPWEEPSQGGTPDAAPAAPPSPPRKVEAASEAPPSARPASTAAPVAAPEPAAGVGVVPPDDLGGGPDAAVGAPPPPVASVASGEGASAPASTLAAEVAMYDQACERLASGAAGEAVAGYERYLQRYPNGRAAAEIQSILDAL